jgi:hypothetical protein
MPFFTNFTKEQVLSYLHSCSDEKLHELNNRIGNFIVTQLDTIDTYEQHTKASAEKIELLSNQLQKIDQENKRFEAYNQNILENLPGNGAERYLVLSALIPIHPPLEQRQHLHTLQNELGASRHKIAWRRAEIKACKKELVLLNKVQTERVEARMQDTATKTMTAKQLHL